MPALPRLLCLMLFAQSAMAATVARPNIVLITLDTTRADRMGFLGSRRELTPHLDALARDSVVFTRAYSQFPLTSASHATILTGTYPQFHHVNDFGIPLAKTLPYLPRILKAQGYKTAAFVGSVILDPASGFAPGFDQGFDTYDAGFRSRNPGDERYETIERRAEDVVARALQWLAGRSRGPFFLWIHLYDPHFPYEPPEPFRKQHAAGLYDGEIAYTDSAVGKLLSQLRAKGLYTNTLITLTADHGEALGEHGESTHGIFLYDETIHVPLLFKMPTQRLAGERLEVRAGLVDVTPTILGILGISVPKAVQGESLVALMKPAHRGTVAAKPPEAPGDRAVYSESDYSHTIFGWSSLRAVRTGKYLFVDAPRKELYDQSRDPGARTNLSSAAGAVSATLAGRLDAFWNKTSSSEKAPEAEASPERERQLAALGYLASGKAAPAGSERSGADPKDKIQIANQLQDALAAEEDGHYPEAVRLLEQVLANEPGIEVAYRTLGRIYRGQEDYDKAIPVLRKAVELRPDSSMNRYELGLALFYTGDLESAEAELAAAIAQSSSQNNAHSLANLHFTLAAVYTRMERAADATKELETAIQLEPDDFDSNLTLGRLLAMQGKAAAGLPYLQKAARVRPDSPDVHFFLAEAYAQLGQQADALREREEVQRLRGLGRP